MPQRRQMTFVIDRKDAVSVSVSACSAIDCCRACRAGDKLPRCRPTDPVTCNIILWWIFRSMRARAVVGPRFCSRMQSERLQSEHVLVPAQWWSDWLGSSSQVAIRGLAGAADVGVSSASFQCKLFSAGARRAPAGRVAGFTRPIPHHSLTRPD